MLGKVVTSVVIGGLIIASGAPLAAAAAIGLFALGMMTVTDWGMGAYYGPRMGYPMVGPAPYPVYPWWHYQTWGRPFYGWGTPLLATRPRDHRVGSHFVPAAGTVPAVAPAAAPRPASTRMPTSSSGSFLPSGGVPKTGGGFGGFGGFSGFGSANSGRDRRVGSRFVSAK